MIVITGGTGFIGSNVCRALAGQYGADVAVVDELTDSAKLQNIEGVPLVDVISCPDFDRILRHGDRWMRRVDAVIHLGACTDTREHNRSYVFATNTHFSKLVLDACISHRVPFLYASSGAVYGLARRFAEDSENEQPRGAYACSKAAFDRHVRKIIPVTGSPVTGLRYFNVYGPGERHKGLMASLIYQLHEQVAESGRAWLFGDLGGCADGEQRRDFIAVADVVRVTLWFLGQTGTSGIFNVGTGVATSFNDIAKLVIDHHGGGVIDYVPLPASLRRSYQILTRADLRALRAAGYPHAMTEPAAGIRAYLRQLSDPA